MASHHILWVNSIATAGCGLGVLVGRSWLYPMFALSTPALLDVIAAGLLVYAAALTYAARRTQIDRVTMLVFAAIDTLWVVGSAAVLLLFWMQLAPLARLLVIAVAVVVEVFATLQFRAALNANYSLSPRN